MVGRTIANPVLVLGLDRRRPATHLRGQRRTVVAIFRTTSDNAAKKRIQMFIQTEPTPNPATLKFLPGCLVMEKGSANFTDAEKARRSPLATALFGLDGISGVYLDSDFITVTKSDDKDWEIMKPHILGAIMDHFQSGKPVIEEPEAEAASPVETGDEDAISSRIKELIDTRIRPAATQDGGDVTYHDFKDGVVYLEFQGSAFNLVTGIENMLRNYVPVTRPRPRARRRRMMKTPSARGSKS